MNKTTLIGIFCISGMIMPQALSNTQIESKEITFPVSTYIDKSNMVDYGLSFELIPNAFTLTYDSGIGSFSDKYLDLKISTSLSGDESNNAELVESYLLTLTENKSACYQENTPSSPEVMGYNDLATVHIDTLSNPLSLGVASDPIYFNRIDTTKNSDHKVILTFKTITDDEVRFCEGQFSLMFRYNL